MLTGEGEGGREGGGGRGKREGGKEKFVVYISLYKCILFIYC